MNYDQRYLDQYKLQQCLRRDTTKEVWKAFDAQEHRYVILTRLHFTAPEALHRFLHETHGIVALQHPHLVPVFEVKVLSRTTSALNSSAEAYIVMDYIEGLSLAQYLYTLSRAQKIASPFEIMHILAPIGSAIDYIHQQGIIHGLIKPSSILLGKNNTPDSPLGSPKLAELGMHNTYDPHQLPPNDVCYIAPEIIQGYTENVRSDLYSLGTILYEMCTGAPPFHGNKTEEVINQQLHVLPAISNQLIELELAAVITCALAKNPAARFPSASLMIHALSNALKVPMPQVSGQVSVAKSPSDSLYSPTFVSPVPQMPHALPASDQEPLAIPTLPPVQPNQHNLHMALAILLVFILLIANVGFFVPQPAASQKPLAGHAFFVSSGLMDLTSSRGIADSLQVHLENVSTPQPGKSYYAWLLAGTNKELDVLPVPLGTLAVHNNQATLDYPGDANHSNLLSKYSRLLVTEENSNLQAVSPSPNTSTWRYAAAFSRTPDPQDTTNHFSLFNHLGHLLAQDPKIKQLGLAGGLDTWLYRNTLKILEWTGSARDLALSHGDTGLIRRQLVRILDYLDGSKFVQTENLPSDLPPVLVDPVIAQVALLQISPEQEPPGYLKHIAKHLYGITQSPGVTADQKQLALEINSAMDNVKTWLTDLHKDAEELIHKPADQLVQPESFPLFNAMFELANNAFVSQTDPHTGQVKEGVAQIHYRIQSLATFDITSCTGNNIGNVCV